MKSDPCGNPVNAAAIYTRQEDIRNPSVCNRGFDFENEYSVYSIQKIQKNEYS